jgi:hypothetical protein
MRTQHVFRQIIRLAQCAPVVFVAFSAKVADSGIVTFQESSAGHWSVEGKTLTLSFGGSDGSSPFTFYESQLVFPNIPNRRGFWEKIE